MEPETRPIVELSWRDIFSLTRQLRANPVKAIETLANRGERVEVRVWPYRILFLNDPAAIEFVLRDRDGLYVRPRSEIQLFSSFLGEGVLALNRGEAWQHAREHTAAALTRPKITTFLPIALREARRVQANWTKSLNETIDLSDSMIGYTLGVVLGAILGLAPDDQERQLWRADLKVLDAEHHRLGQLIKLPRWLPTPSARRFHRALASVRERIEQRITDHLGEREPPPSMLSHLLEQDAKPEESKLNWVRDQLLTYVFAGYDTTATALIWAWTLLAQNQRVEKDWQEELQAVLSGQEPRAEQLSRLDLTAQIFRESLRLYPPVWILGRQANADHDLLGYPVKAASQLLFSSWALHRHPDHWPQAHEFRPQRFASNNKEARHPFAYLPFGGGPRVCPGSALARMEAVTALSVLGQSFKVTPLPHDFIPGHNSSIRPPRLLASLQAR